MPARGHLIAAAIWIIAFFVAIVVMSATRPSLIWLIVLTVAIGIVPYLVARSRGWLDT